MASMTNQAAKLLILQPALTAIRDPAEWKGSFADNGHRPSCVLVDGGSGQEPLAP
jgi:hypothetical protein